MFSGGTSLVWPSFSFIMAILKQALLLQTRDALASPEAIKAVKQSHFMELHALKLGGDKKVENSGSTMAILVFISLGAHCTEEGAHCTEYMVL